MEDNSTTILIILGIVSLITLIWSIRGLIQLFQRYNTLLVIAYIIFIFPVAYFHMLILGMFGSSKVKRDLEKVKKQAKFDLRVEEEKKSINRL